MIELPEFYTNALKVLRSPHLERRVMLGMLLQINPSVGLDDPTSFLDGYPWDVGLATAAERSGYSAVMESFKNHRRVGLPLSHHCLSAQPL